MGRHSHLGKHFEIQKMLNIELTYQAEAPILGIYPSALKIYVHTQVFIATLFIITKTGNS